MKAAFTTFFRNSIARSVAVVVVLFVVAGLLLTVLDAVEGRLVSIWAIGSVAMICLPLMLLAVVIEYLSRIADALEKPGALGFEDEAGQ